MLKTRKFSIVLVAENKGTGENRTVKPDKVVDYNGKAIQIKL